MTNKTPTQLGQEAAKADYENKDAKCFTEMLARRWYWQSDLADATSAYWDKKSGLDGEK